MTISLVTGGAGFVGRHLIRQLLERGDEVVCVDSIVNFTGGIDPLDGWPLYEPRDFRNFTFIREDCRSWFDRNQNFKCDYAFHLAAMVGGRAMIESNPLALAVDLSLDASFWQWAAAATPRKAVCFSSSAAYPISLQTKDSYRLLSETDISFADSIGVPDMTYGWAKLTSEFLAQTAHQKHGIESICFRPFSGYGPDQDLAYPFPSICSRALDQKGANEIAVWGSGLQMRDFIHINDCVAGILLMTDKISDASAVNLSTGIYTNFIELARIATNAVGFQPVVTGSSSKPEGVFARAGATERQRELGFTAAITLLDGVTECLNWIEKRRN